ncbi:protein translocase subunit SecF [Cyanobium sp. Morenito 9A2]|uniref:protein translocase subunit SecF n=1 Tax=Cyanobium sp. Morenito 9A2 TaxID=2823718 RepID=UPI0020CB6AFA|nr:protein translocase subunit SecF [Cyanobium sp. Morenito 9A2]MCP9850498.1 protein translocase subunit SecF [Cyanobium sp. Morenito 9A2]
MVSSVPVRPASAPIQPRFRINRHRVLCWWISGVACLLSVVGMGLCWINPAIGAPLKPGLDFTGGTQIQLERRCGADCGALQASQLRGDLERITLPPGEKGSVPNLAGASVQLLDKGETVLLRLSALSPDQTNAVIEGLKPRLGPLSTKGTQVNTIGPTLGAQILTSSIQSLLVSFLLISLYITFRYDRIYAFLALLCLAHDVLITCGLFAWLGLIGGIEVDTLFAVSLLTVAGYSVTDTVVVFDRIREKQAALGDRPVADQVDDAVAATLTRSLYTSLTTSLPLLGLIFFGGSTLFWFALALAVGIAAGSWSSIAVAPTLLPLIWSAPKPRPVATP